MNAMMLLPVHILAGSIAIVAGALAVVVGKGTKLHRRGGRVFVYSMLVMGGTAAMISLVGEVNVGNVLQATLVGYMVITAMLAVRHEPYPRGWDIGAMAVVLSVTATHATFAVLAARSESGAIGGYSPPMFIVFGSIALLAGVGDIRMLAWGPLRGARRIARHLWRMSFALFIATGSFFMGQADEFPEALRVMPVLIALGVAPLFVMFYWLWRVRIRGNLSRIVGEAARTSAAVAAESGIAPAGARVTT